MEAASGRDRESVCDGEGRKTEIDTEQRRMASHSARLCTCGYVQMCVLGPRVPLYLSNILQLLLDSSPAHPQPATYGPPITK